LIFLENVLRRLISHLVNVSSLRM